MTAAKGRPVFWWRVLWLFGVGLPLALTLLSWPAYIQLLLKPCAACLMTPAMAGALQAAGLSLWQWAALNMAAPALDVIAWTGVGLFVFWRQRNPGALLISALLVLAGPGFGGFQFDLTRYHPEWWLIGRLIQVTSTTALFGLVLVLPTGRVAPRWTVWPMLYVMALNVHNQFFPESPLAFGNWPMPLPIVLFFAPLLISVIVIPVYRYQRILTASERQQVKWAVLGILAFVACVAVILVFTTSCVAGADAVQSQRCNAISNAGLGLASITIPLSIGIAILRSRLWDIDVIIRRTLIYGLLTGLLAAAYFASVVVLQNIFSALTGRSQSTLVTVLSTLAIAALFIPLRARVQAVIDRRLYRRKYDAARTLAEFGASLRDEVDMESLTQHLLTVVDETMQPASVNMWLRAPERRQL